MEGGNNGTGCHCTSTQAVVILPTGRAQRGQVFYGLDGIGRPAGIIGGTGFVGVDGPPGAIITGVGRTGEQTSSAAVVAYSVV